MTTPLYRHWRRLIAVAVIALHIAGLLALAGMQGKAVKSTDHVLQISFISRPKPALKPVLPIEKPAPKPQQRSHSRATKARPTTALIAISVPETAPAPLQLSPATPDEWAPPPAIGPGNALTRPAYVDRLPGSAEAIVEGVHLHEKLTPQKVVEGIGAMLFGARKVNFCEDAKTHLANRTSSRNRLAIEDDLRLIERDCRD